MGNTDKFEGCHHETNSKLVYPCGGRLECAGVAKEVTGAVAGGQFVPRLLLKKGST